MNTPLAPITAIVVDDSAVVRKHLADLLTAGGIHVIATASDPLFAWPKMAAQWPDVVVLDVEMPRMDGITFLGNLMRLRPMPVVMVSSLTEQGADVTLSALELGAIDFVTKPKIDISHGLASYAAEIIDKVKAASRARVRARQDLDKSSGARRPAQQVLKHYRTTDRLIAIGASTGGTEALREVLEMMPADAPAIVITQHIPEAFSQPFARRLNSASAMSVCQAEDGQQIVQGHAYVAPGNRHLRVIRSGARYVCRLDDGEPVNRHKPSVDVMFMSVAENVGRNAVGVLLTGMGADGAQGMRAMKEAGAPTLAQDEATSVVWGMPGEAVKIGVVDHVLPLDRIAAHGLQLASR